LCLKETALASQRLAYLQYPSSSLLYSVEGVYCVSSICSHGLIFVNFVALFCFVFRERVRETDTPTTPTVGLLVLGELGVERQQQTAR
jgi:hypothetical protein